MAAEPIQLVQSAREIRPDVYLRRSLIVKECNKDATLPTEGRRDDTAVLEEASYSMIDFLGLSKMMFGKGMPLKKSKRLRKYQAQQPSHGLIIYSRAMISMLFLGYLGELELAGGSLSIGVANITGYSVISGLAMGMDPICGQAYGAKQFKLLGLTLQRTVLLLLTTSIPISFMWLNMKRILLWCNQDEEISETAQNFIVFAVPDLFFLSILHPLRIYLRTQGITLPLTYCSTVSVILHVPLNFLLVGYFKMGISGVALAMALTNLNLLGLPAWVVEAVVLSCPNVRFCLLGVVVVRADDNALRFAVEPQGDHRVDGDSHPDDFVGLRLPLVAEPRRLDEGQQRAGRQAAGQGAYLDDRVPGLRRGARLRGHAVHDAHAAPVGPVLHGGRGDTRADDGGTADAGLCELGNAPDGGVASERERPGPPSGRTSIWDRSTSSGCR
ncbi:hypothetical protein DH2020_035696 [Rehmannia glutinosa]|uniref:Protein DETOXIFICATION n=1 Tax=Rehmannia glutinosa TaxID=99300 RepID=A0ABR0V5Y6_REHGL